MTRMIVRQGDAGSHGGTVTGGASKSKAEGKLIARVGDIYACPIDGDNPIAVGSPNSKCEGAAIARNGDTTSCGATLIASATKTACN